MFNAIYKRHLLIIHAWPRREAQHGWRHQVCLYFVVRKDLNLSVCLRGPLKEESVYVIEDY
jgi:hypothetical protein